MHIVITNSKHKMKTQNEINTHVIYLYVKTLKKEKTSPIQNTYVIQGRI